VDAWENRGANHCKKRHRFRGAVNRSTPFLPEQKQDRRDQCAGMSDTDPENEVCNVPRPANRDLISPCANASGNEISNAKKTKRRGAGGNRKCHPPPAWRRLFHHTGYALGQPAEVAPV
jgi:hypothetical protein